MAKIDEESYSRACAPEIIKWLLTTYEQRETNDYLPRNELYNEYRKVFAGTPAGSLNSSIFGKLVRRAFPHSRVKRISRNREYKYCYMGLVRKCGNTTPAPSQPVQAEFNHTCQSLSPSRATETTTPARTITAYQLSIMESEKVPPLCYSNPELAKDPLAKQFVYFSADHYQRMSFFAKSAAFSAMREEKHFYFATLMREYRSLISRQDFVEDLCRYSEFLLALIPFQLVNDPLAECSTEIVSKVKLLFTGAATKCPLEMPPESKEPPFNAFFTKLAAMKEYFMSLALPRLSLAIIAQEVRSIFSNAAISRTLCTAWRNVATAAISLELIALMRNGMSPMDRVSPKDVIENVLQDFSAHLEHYTMPYQWAQWAEHASKMLASVGIDWSRFCTAVHQELAVALASNGNTKPSNGHVHSPLSTLWLFLSKYVVYKRLLENTVVTLPPGVSLGDTADDVATPDSSSEGECDVHGLQPQHAVEVPRSPAPSYCMPASPPLPTWLGTLEEDSMRVLKDLFL